MICARCGLDHKNEVGCIAALRAKVEALEADKERLDTNFLKLTEEYAKVANECNALKVDHACWKAAEERCDELTWKLEAANAALDAARLGERGEKG